MFTTLKLAAALVFAGAVSAGAATVEFVAPNNGGQVFTNNTNDGWSGGRGIGFTVSADQTISSVGVYQDLTNISLSFGVYEISGLSGSFTRGAALRSGTSLVTTTGLEWVDFGFADLGLTAGSNYLIEFSFSGLSNQNFFYNNGNVAWTQGAYSSLEGTSGSSFGNSVVGAFRVDGQAGSPSPVPLPAAMPLLLGGFAVMGFVARRRRG